MFPLSASNPPLPTFLIIGAQKSATRWLRSNIGLHPEIFTADEELSFFNHPRRFQNRGLDWYRSQFEGWSGELTVGESTPGYMIWRHEPGSVAQRIHEVIPEVKLMAILRNPVDRAYSAMVHQVWRKRVRHRSGLLKIVRRHPPETERFGFVAGGWYASSLKPYYDLFGDQLLVLLHDDIRHDAAGVYTRATSHIGADPSFVPSELTEVRHSNRQRTKPVTELTFDERLELYEYFRDDIGELEQMIGRDLSMWQPKAVEAVDTDQTAAVDTPDDADHQASAS